MSRWICCLGVPLLLCVAEVLVAGDFELPRHEPGRAGGAVPCCCPDDYCRKPLPWTPCCPVPVCADDYCPKLPPILACFAIPRCADNYCRKPLPQLCWPASGAFYRCPPGADCVVLTPPEQKISANGR